MKLVSLLGFFILVSVSGCGGKYAPEQDSALRALQCPSTDRTYSYDEIEYHGGTGDGRVSFSELKDSVNSSCMGCHQAPAQSGGFTCAPGRAQT